MSTEDAADVSKRWFQRATYTPLRTLVAREGGLVEPDEAGDAMAKLSLLQGLEVAPGEADSLRQNANSDAREAARVVDVVRRLGIEPPLEVAPAAARLRDSALRAFSTLLLAQRQTALADLERGIDHVREQYSRALTDAAREAVGDAPPSEFSVAARLSSLERSVAKSERVRALAFSDNGSAGRLRSVVVSGTSLQAAKLAHESTAAEVLGWAVVNAAQSLEPLRTTADLHLFPLQKSSTPALPERLLLAQAEIERKIAAQSIVVAAYGRRPLEPLGLLHLERLEMTPGEIVRGELVYSLPLAPLERVSISHREWTTFQEEFSRYIQDYKEDYSERGVAQSEDVAMATSAQSRHSNALSMGQSPAGADLELGVTAAVSLGPTSSVEDETSRSESRNELRQLTARASTRTIRDHKVSFTVSRATGTETSSARVIRNPHKDKALQLDYYRRMRRWSCELYRWGVRMTWDLVLPDPGRALRGRVQELSEVETKLAKPFAFELTVSQVSAATWERLAAEYGATLAPPPTPRRVEVAGTFEYDFPNVATARADGPFEIVPGQPAWVRSWQTEKLEFSILQGYEARTIDVSVNARFFRFDGDDPYVEFAGEGGPRRLTPTAGQPSVRDHFQVSAPLSASGDRVAFLSPLAVNQALGLVPVVRERSGYVDHYQAPFTLKHVATAAITLSCELEPSDQLVDAWRIKCWAQLREAAAARDARLREQWRDRRAVLLRELAATDALTLRRREREQTMRLVLSWLLPDFAASNDVLDVIAQAVVSGNALPTAADGLTRLQVLEYGAHIRFIHDAVDWNRLHYILYPYFWDADVAQSGKLFLEHPDPAHREFLRAGAVRVLLPIQPGFEEAFASLVHLGAIGALADSHRFLVVAKDVQAANEKFGEPDPNADPRDVRIPGVLIGRWEDSTPTAALELDATSIALKK